MIKNDQEYKNTKYLAEEFEKTIAAMELDEERKRHDYQKWEMGRGAAQCHLDKLRAEIAEYEMLISHDSQVPIVLKLDDNWLFARYSNQSAHCCEVEPKRACSFVWIYRRTN